jgi:hypothetical protein
LDGLIDLFLSIARKPLIDSGIATSEGANTGSFRHSRLAGIRLAPAATAALVYLAGYVVVTFPWALRLWWLAPAGGDEGMFVWGFAWMRRALASLEWPFATTNVLAPLGATLAFHTWMPLEALVSVPLQLLTGPILAYNLMAVVSVVLAGLCTYYLARDFGVGRVPAFFAGLMFAFAPPVAFRYGIGHQNLAQVFWIPLVVLVTRRLLRKPSARLGLFLGLAGAGSLMSDLTVAVYAAAAALSYLLAWMIYRRDQPGPRVLRALIVAGVVGTVAALPLFIAMAQAVFTGALGEVPGLAGSPIYSNDLAGFFVSPAQHPVLGPFLASWRASLAGSQDGPGYTGITIALLAAIGLVTQRSRPIARWLGLLAVVSLVLSLGPTLIVFGRRLVPLSINLAGDPSPVSLVMPYTWIQAIPGLRQLRVPSRMLLLSALPLALLGALALERMFARLPSLAAPSALLVAGLVLFEAYTPVTVTMDAQLPRVYQVIASDADKGAIVVDIPLGFRTGFSGVGVHPYTGPALVYAAQHGKAVAVGFVSRLADGRLHELARLPLYRDLIALQSVAPGQPPPLTSPSEGRAMAAKENIKYVVIRTDVAQDIPGIPLVRQYLIEACYQRTAADDPYELYRFEC